MPGLDHISAQMEIEFAVCIRDFNVLFTFMYISWIRDPSLFRCEGIIGDPVQIINAKLIIIYQTQWNISGSNQYS